MNLAKPKSWLSIVANLGLLEGIALVAYEINQNSKLARMALVNEGNVASNQFWANLMGETPVDVIAKSVECPKAMTYRDYIAMDAYLFIGINVLYRNFELAQEGIFTEEDWQKSVESYAAWYLGNPFGRAWWSEEGRYFFADDFVNHVDRQLEGKARDSYDYWLGVRTRLFGPGNKDNPVVESLCPPPKYFSNTSDTMAKDQFEEFATEYTAAWCSQNASSVASFFEVNGSLTINNGEPSIGRDAITEAAQGFMTAFPDMIVQMDGLDFDGQHLIYRWTLTGTNSGPGGTGNAVRISGFEKWTMSPDGLIAESSGSYDAAEYERQLREGIGRARE